MTTDQQIKVDAYKFGGGELTARLLKCDDKFAKIEEIVEYVAENYVSLSQAENDGDFTVIPYLVAFDNAVKRADLTFRQQAFLSMIKEGDNPFSVANKLGDTHLNVSRDYKAIIRKISIEFAKGDNQAWY